MEERKQSGCLQSSPVFEEFEFTCIEGVLHPEPWALCNMLIIITNIIINDLVLLLQC